MKNYFFHILALLLRKLVKISSLRNLAATLLHPFPKVKALFIRLLYKDPGAKIQTLYLHLGEQQEQLTQQLHSRSQQLSYLASQTNGKLPELAFISPLPPSTTGIATYSAELLAVLAKYYTITVVTEKEPPQLDASYPWLNAKEFAQQAHRFPRKLYQIGNSLHHWWQFNLLYQFPGIIVLHDFYLYDAIWWAQHAGIQNNALTRALYREAGYPAVIEYENADPATRGPEGYPVNRQVIENATSIICHSQHAQQLITQTYPGLVSPLVCIPHLRGLNNKGNQQQARQHLGTNPQELILASFGGINPKKGIEELVHAFAQADFTRPVRLVLAGANHQGEFGQRIQQLIAAHPKARITITGYLSTSDYQAWLQAADAAIQLRTQTRGESSGALLDALAFGLPVLINAHGSHAELPPDACYQLPETFSQQQLTTALQELTQQPQLRERLARAGRNYLKEHHHPETIAAAYNAALEASLGSPLQLQQKLLDQMLAQHKTVNNKQPDLVQLALSLLPLAQSLVPPQPRIYIDITTLAWKDQKTGIERVTKELSKQLLTRPPVGWKTELICWQGDHFNYANDHAARLLNIKRFTAINRPIEPRPGDLYLSFEWAPPLLEQAQQEMARLKRQGIHFCFTVHDLLPLTLPQHFPQGTPEKMATWFQQVSHLADLLVCVSQATQQEVATQLSQLKPAPAPRLAHIHLGAEAQPEQLPKLTRREKNQLKLIKQLPGPLLLMVGTLEPRKGHQQVLAALEQLWADQQQVSLVIVGKQGWNLDRFAKHLRQHPQRNHQLVWVEGASDSLLTHLYQTSDWLLAASEGEGFGLPLIEAAQHNLPLLARDLPVFREVAGNAANYFQADTATQLAQALQKQLQTPTPTPSKLHYNTWSDTAQALEDTLGQHQLLEIHNHQCQEAHHD